MAPDHFLLSGCLYDLDIKVWLTIAMVNRAKKSWIVQAVCWNSIFVANALKNSALNTQNCLRQSDLIGLKDKMANY